MAQKVAEVSRYGAEDQLLMVSVFGGIFRSKDSIQFYDEAFGLVDKDNEVSLAAELSKYNFRSDELASKNIPSSFVSSAGTLVEKSSTVSHAL